MSYDIITLVPNAYTKKLKKSSNSGQVDEVVLAIGKKFSEWGVNYSSESHAGTAHKLKYEQFCDHFLSKSNLILYVVDFSSEESFRISIKKLVSSCKNNEDLSRIIVLSLDKPHFVELDGTTVDLVHFGDNTWRSEEDIRWTSLEETLQKKLLGNRNDPNNLKTDTLTAPVSIPNNKSSKIKSFFHSLPSKFDLEKRWSLRSKHSPEIYNESVPNIKISDFQEENVVAAGKDNTIELRPKESHSKLSLNSLFRKRSRKARDSGLSMNSSLSNGSDSKKSDIVGSENTKNAYPVCSVSADVSPAYERPEVLRTASLVKPKKYKATIEIFKNKANKAFQSANCLHSPANKRHKHVEDTLADNYHFSGGQINDFKYILINGLECSSTSRDALPIIGQRGHSEPPIDVSLSKNYLPVNGMVKYYSWNEDLNKSEESIINELTYTDEKSAPTDLQANNDELYYQPFLYNDEILDDMESPGGRVLSSFDCEENSAETKTGDTDDNYFQVQYVPNTPNNPIKTEKHSVSFKIEGMDSLENIMESIQKSCHEMKINFKPQNNNGVVLKTFKEGSDKKSSHHTNPTNVIGDKGDEIPNEIFEENTKIYVDQLHTMVTASLSKNILSTPENEAPYSQSLVLSPSLHRAPQIPIRLESIIDPPQSFLYRTATSIIENPLIVASLFTATVLTAPIWSTYIPHSSDLSRLFSGTINRVLGSGIVQSISSKLISTKIISASASTDSVETFYKEPFLKNVFFHIY